MQIKSFDQLNTSELYQILKLRVDVFCVEQACPYADLDNLDQQAWHVFTTAADGAVMAYARILPPGLSYPEDSSIARVVTAEKARAQKLGVRLMQKAIDFCQNQYPGHAISISAQSYLHRFYHNLGFVDTGEYYLEDDIPHQHMRLL
ncbi:GNAT family N-acetyltransferase [Marinicella sp. W31]|uniref:GNAT family N-acetyltransferase n=1 Tax=Marinicella sp. W31 TaxID=3023713 RepID=UPI003756D483